MAECPERNEMKPVRCGCGGEAKVEYWVGRWYVRCQNANCFISTKFCDTEAEAITAWNRAMGGSCKKCNNHTERTAKVTEVKTDDDVYDIKGVHTWCKEYRCEKCGFIQFAIEDHGRYTYCPSCGCRLEWE